MVKLNKAGFTLIEVLLVVSLIVLTAGLSLPVARSLQTTNDVDVATIALAQNLRYAQQLAASGANDDNWGVQISSGTITVYRGASYAARVSSFDQTNSMASSIVPSGVSEVNFAKATGLPGTTGTVTLTGLHGKVTTVTINAKGTVLY